MCKGGRMTLRLRFVAERELHAHSHGTGAWPSEPDPFLITSAAVFQDAGRRVDDDGAVIPAVYWSCFREGY